jgi:hypothetical protein
MTLASTSAIAIAGLIPRVLDQAGAQSGVSYATVNRAVKSFECRGP